MAQVHQFSSHSTAQQSAGERQLATSCSSGTLDHSTCIIQAACIPSRRKLLLATTCSRRQPKMAAHGLMQRAAGALTSARPSFCAGLGRVVRPSLVTKSPVAVSDSHGLNGATVATDGKPHSNGYSFHTSSPFIFGSPSAEDLDVFKREAAGHSARDDHSPVSFSTSASSSASSTHASGPASTSTSAPERPKHKYPRVLLKISGEALQGKNQGGIDPTVLNLVAEEIAEAHHAGLELAVVVGGGNFFRGCTAPKGMDRAQADYVGMLATVMNAILLQVGNRLQGETGAVGAACEALGGRCVRRRMRTRRWHERCRTASQFSGGG